ncbi:MAG: hypothetical protein EA417_12010 [Gammaproteobacteria bacterium]|nr:MAG: hypothetical protein EA417_12010 [Gammaproteobacteria bacterium]
MSFNLMPVRLSQEDIGEVWRCAFDRRETDYYLEPVGSHGNLNAEPAINPHYRGELDFNLSNRNMALVMSALSLRMSDEGALFKIEEFQAATTRWLTRNMGVPSQEIPTTKCSEDRWVEFGVDEGYLNRKIEQAAAIAREGRTRGATHIMVI